MVSIPVGLVWKFCFIIFAGASFGALQNITVDDAILTGNVVPQYLPNASSWNQGNNCTGCLAKPDPSKAYDGTWHDTTFQPDSQIFQMINLTFVGNALYIFFILANTIPNASTSTNLVFYLDGTTVNTFEHTPSPSADYEYDIPVYVNGSLTFGEHNVLINPINAGTSVLMLFDYLIYTTEINDTMAPSSSLPAMATSSSTPSATDSSSNPSATDRTTSYSNKSTIVGGTIGGIALLLLMLVSSLFYWRHRGHSSLKKSTVPESLIPLDKLAPGPSSPAPTERWGFQDTMSWGSWRLSGPPISVDPPSTAGNNAVLSEEVKRLRDEIAHLSRIQRLDNKGVPHGLYTVNVS